MGGYCTRHIFKIILLIFLCEFFYVSRNPVSTEHKWIRKLWLEISDKDLFKGLEACKPETSLGKNPEIFQRGKLKLLILRSTFLRRLKPAFLALGLAQYHYQSDERQSGRWMPDGLDTWVPWWVTTGWSGGLMSIQALTRDCKVHKFKFPG